jgi:hypothetical protein
LWWFLLQKEATLIAAQQIPKMHII